MDTEDLLDAKRELDKAGSALNACALHFEHQGKADAALHLSQVMYNPLAAKTFAAAEEARRASDRMAEKIAEHQDRPQGPDERPVGE